MADQLNTQDRPDLIIEPHPDFESLSIEELRECLKDADDRLNFANKHGAEPWFRTYLVQEIRACQAELNRRLAAQNGGEFIPHYRETNPAEPILTLLTWQEFRDSAPERREYSVEGILPDVGLSVLQGRGKQGKSTLAIHLLRSVALGEPFLERNTKKKSTIYVNYEMPGDYLATLLGPGPHPPDAYIISRPAPILSFELLESILSKVGSGAVLLVIDSFRGAFKLQGKGENLAGESGRILRLLQDLAIAKNSLIKVIHHSNRTSAEGTDSVSGTGDWIAAPDAIWTWSRPDKDKSGTLYIEGRIPPIDPLAVDLSLDACVFLGTQKADRERADKEAILTALDAGPLDSNDIAEATRIPGGTVRVRLKSLEAEGRVKVVSGTGKKNDAFMYQKWFPQERSSVGAEIILHNKTLGEEGRPWRSYI